MRSPKKNKDDNDKPIVAKDAHFGRIVTFLKIDKRSTCRTLAQSAARYLGLGYNVKCVNIDPVTGAILWRRKGGKIFSLGFIHDKGHQVYEKMPNP